MEWGAPCKKTLAKTKLIAHTKIVKLMNLIIDSNDHLSILGFFPTFLLYYIL